MKIPSFPGFHTIKMVDFPASELLVYRRVHNCFQMGGEKTTNGRLPPFTAADPTSKLRRQQDLRRHVLRVLGTQR